MKKVNVKNLLNLVMLSSFISSSACFAKPDGADIFKNNCASCHAGGKNIMSPNKPIIGSDKISTKEKFTKFLSTSHGVMPSFAKIANDEPTVSALHDYVKTLK